MPSPAQITPNDISEMVRHWLETPPEGYLGSSYGSDVKSLLQRPQGDSVAMADFLSKMRVDLPVLEYLPSDAVRVWFDSDGADKMILSVDVAGILIQAGGAN